MTSFSSVLTRAPITPSEVSRRYSKLLFALKILITSDEGLNYQYYGTVPFCAQEGIKKERNMSLKEKLPGIRMRRYALQKSESVTDSI